MFRLLARFLLLLVLPVLPLTLTACGGGSDDDDPAPAPAAEEADPADGADAEEADAEEPAPTMTGNWIGEFGTGVAFSLALVQTDDALTGTYATGSFDGTVTGTVSGNDVEMTVVVAGGPTSKFTGTVNEDRTSMNGNFNIIAGGGGNGTWSATK